ncbi:hypothetical protein ABBQ32_013012 [Trebouxia sp. C0010 RCD-2024]
MQGVVVTCVKSYMTNCFAGQAMLSIIGPAEYRLAVTDSFAQESVGSLLKENNTSGTCTNTGTLRNEAAPLALLTSEDIATVSSVMQRMVEVVSYRAAVDAHINLIEHTEAKQDAIWEAEFQAEDRQQHLIHQRLARRSSLQRCAPSRSISMPSTSQQPNSHPKRDKSDLSECSPFAAASPSGTHDDLPGVSQQCGEQRRLTTAHLPLIRVPSSLNEAHPSTSASGTAMASSRSTGVSSSGSAGAVYVTPYMPPFGSISGKTGRQRRVSDASQAASPSLQAVLSLAAKVPPSGHASAVLKTGQVCRMRVQPKARVKAGLGSRDKCVPSTGKGKTMGDKGLLRQSSHTEAPPCLHRASMASLSRGQSLAAGRAGSHDLTNSPVLLNSVPQHPLSHAGLQSHCSFYLQPSPSAVLASGAPLLLQKRITELIRRQNDTVKWEQKNSRNSEHRDGLTLPQPV